MNYEFKQNRILSNHQSLLVKEFNKDREAEDIERELEDANILLYRDSMELIERYAHRAPTEVSIKVLDKIREIIELIEPTSENTGLPF